AGSAALEPVPTSRTVPLASIGAPRIGVAPTSAKPVVSAKGTDTVAPPSVITTGTLGASRSPLDSMRSVKTAGSAIVPAAPFATKPRGAGVPRHTPSELAAQACTLLRVGLVSGS